MTAPAQTAVSAIIAGAADSPRRTLLIWEPHSGPARRWTRAELLRDVECAASRLLDSGVGPGERVIIHTDNSPEQFIAWLACMRINAIAVMGNMNADEADLAHCARLTAPRAVLAPDAGHASILADACDAPPGILSAHELSRGRGAALPAPGTVNPAGPATIIFTSGTTGRPKAVLWTHRNIAFGGAMNARRMGIGPEDICLCHMPLYHTVGLSFLAATTIMAGGTLVLQPGFSRDRFWDVSVNNACTWTALPPQCVYALKEDLTEPVRHGYRFWLLGAGGIEPVEKGFGVRTIGAWGMSETIAPAIAGDSAIANAPMSIGTASPDYEFRIVAPSGGEAPDGETGHLLIRGVRGETVFSGYFADDDATAAAFDGDGWFDTGDLVRRDSDGWLYFEGRAKDLIKVGGENIIPLEIESVFTRHPAVQECAVVGRPDKVFDEVPVAFVIPAQDVRPGLATDIMKECNAGLSALKRVREIIFAEELPRSTIRKVAKDALRKWLDGNEEPAGLSIIPTPRDDLDTASMETDDIRREVFTIWQQVVNDDSGTVEDSLNFFGLGGDSLMVFEFVTRLSERFGVRIEAEAVFDHPTLGELTRHIELILLARRLTGGVAEAGARYIEV